jgi:Domain of unknown function (DUF4276)
VVKEVRLYIEGDTKQKGSGSSITLRQGFNEFFDKWAKEAEIKINLQPILCGDRGKAVKIFLNDDVQYAKGFAVLLIDSEREKDIGDDAKFFLQADFPNYDFKKIKDSQCHFMVQAMESWFMADKEKLAACYDNKFNEKALPKNKEVEKIPKNDAIDKLKKATKDTRNGKGEYGKGADSGKILGEIRPQKVIDAAPHCEKLFTAIREAIK